MSDNNQHRPHPHQRLRMFRASSVLFAFFLLEIGLHFVEPPMTWTAGSFDGNRWSLRLWTWWDHKRGGEFNQWGYRDENWTATPIRPRVAMIGDSRMFGLNLDLPDTIPSQVARAAPAWETLNLGIVGATPVESLDFVANEALNLGATGAVICVDINPSLQGLASRKDFSRRDQHLRNAWRSVATLRWAELALWALYRDGDRIRVQADDEYRADLDAVLKQLQAGGATQQVVLIGWTPMPDFDGLYEQSTYDLYRQASREVAQQNGAAMVEVEAVIGDMPQEQAFDAPGLYYTPPAAERIGQAIASALGDPA